MSKKNVGWGLVLIVLAVYLIVSRMGLLPALPFFKVIFTAFFGYGVIHGILKRSFFETIMSLAILGCMYDDLLHIEAITPWILLFSALLISCGLDMIFRNWRHRVHVEGSFRSCRTDNYADSDFIKCENSFGSTNKYVNTDHLTGAAIENNFGALNVYFDNAVIANGEAEISVENNFGETNLYIPKTWRVDCKQSTAFGDIRFYGQANADMDAPLLRINAETNFGAIKVYFN